MVGFDESVARRIGRRPGRWFVGLWCALTTPWLVSGLIGFELERSADIPPVPEAIPYADFLPGGVRYDSSFKVDLDPQQLPTFDPTLQDRFLFVHIWPTASGDGRLVCNFFTVEGVYGWPKQWVSWSRGVTYDVTDPSEPFDRAQALPPFWVDIPRWEITRTGWSIRNADRLTYWNVHWEWNRMLLWALSIEALAGLVVFVIWMRYVLVIRRRLRRGLCLECGYDLRGTKPGDVCPECATVRGQPEQAKPRRLPLVRVFVVAWLLLVVASFVMGLFVVDRRQMPPLQEGLAELAAEGGSRPAHLMLTFREHGWPLPFLTVWDSQSYQAKPGQWPVVLDANVQFDVYADFERIQWELPNDDPTVRTIVDITWPFVLVQTAALQFAALGLILVVRLAVKLRRWGQSLRRTPALE